MGKPNYGKDFEHIVKTCLLKVDGVDVQRLYDSTNGFVGVKNPSDFIVYKFPHQYYLECKCLWENTLRPDKVTQLSDLVKKSSVRGVYAGVLVWWIEHDITVYVPAVNLAEHYKTHKSLNVKDIMSWEVQHIRIKGEKKRVFFNYDFESFFKEFEYVRFEFAR
jgi:hypothetical protein